MRRICSAILLAGLIGIGSAPGAEARMGGTVLEFERYLRSLPGSNFKRVPDEANPGLLYSGRFAEFSTLVRVFVENDRIVRQRIEVALPVDKQDDYALVIISRLLGEFTGYPGEIRSLMDQARAMRGSIIGTGRRSTAMTYRGARITLALDSSPNELHQHPSRGAWGLLFWRADAERIGRKPTS